jgi:capsular polysaccharide biosynthesis protein
MSSKNMLRLVNSHLKSAILAGMFLGAVSFLTLVATQKSFKSSLDLLVVQNQTGSADYYTMSRSADYLTNIITESVYSEKFLSEAFATGKISSSLLPRDNAERLKEWQKIVSVKKNSNVGILNVNIFADTQNQAAEISAAVADVLQNKNSLFLGQGQNLEIRILSGPIIEKNPSVSQIALASVGGMVTGTLLFLLFVIYREEFNQENYRQQYYENLNRYENGESREEENEATVVESNEEKNQDEYFSENGDFWKERLNQMRS